MSDVARAVGEPEGILAVHIWFLFLVERIVCQKIKTSANLFFTDYLQNETHYLYSTEVGLQY